MKKVCTKCKVEKEISEFTPRHDSPGKYISQCKQCKREYTAKRTKEFPHLARQSMKNYKIKNREKILEYGRQKEKLRMQDEEIRKKKKIYNAEYARTHKKKAYMSVGDKVYYQGLGYTIVGSVYGKGMLIRRLYGQPIMVQKRLLSKHANNT